MTEIHPTAIIDPRAELGADIVIGPYCVVGAGVVVGDGCRLHHHVSVTGPTRLGPANEIHPFASLGGRTQDLKYAGEPTYLEIGGHNTFREFCTVNRGTAPGSYTRIGSHNHFLSYCHIAHDCTVGDHVIFSNNGTLAGHVEVEDHVILGGLTAVHQFCRLGRHAITGGCSKIVQDVPPFTTVDGNPGAVRGLNAVGLQRHGFSEEEIAALKEAYKALFLRKISQDEALATLDHLAPAHPAVAHLAAFVRSSTRGLCHRPRR